MRNAIGLAVAALLLGACSHAPPPVDTSLLPNPDARLMERPQPLPDLPACGKLATELARVDCRKRYDTTSRAQYAGVASRLDGLQDYVTALKGKQVVASK